MPAAPETPEDPKLGLAAEILRCRGTIHLKAWGASMLPTVWAGDLLTIESVAYDEVIAGDIVLVLCHHRFFIHRLVERRQGQDCFSLITRGDAMPHDDPPAAVSELLGRVARIRRGNRSFIPNRRLSLRHSALAWMLCRSDRFRGLTLRIRAASLQTGSTRAGRFFRSVYGAVRGIPAISPSHTSHP